MCYASGMSEKGEMLSVRLSMIVLPDAADGREIRLGSLWSNRPAVLAFLRHYG